jgi:hypothetical protein
VSKHDDIYITGLYAAWHIVSRKMAEVYDRLLEADDRRCARIVLDAADELRKAIDAKISDENRDAEVPGA